MSATTKGATAGSAAAKPRVTAQTPRRSALQVVPHLTPEEHAARGKAARAEVPRRSHATWDPPEHRANPVDLLESQAETRVPELVPIRYGRMLVSPFAFYRGAAYIMAADLAATPRSGLTAQICGDAHLSNFGGFASPDRRLVFDINDFDETLPGPWEWDVKRLAASFEIVGRDRGFSAAERRTAVLESVRSYRDRMRKFAAMSNMDVWYSRLDIESRLPEIQGALGSKRSKALQASIAKARTKDSMKALGKLTHMVDGKPRILSDPPLVVPIAELLSDEEAEQLEKSIRGLIRLYRASLQNDRRVLVEQFRFADMARKVVGVGSVGTRAWIILMLGRDEQDPLFLQVKEAGPSVLEEFLGGSAFKNGGERVVEGQRLMQASSDIFLGWIRTTGLDGVQRDFYIRQLWDWKTSVDLEIIRPKGLAVYAQLCGGTLARAHARSGDRIAIAAYLGGGAALDESMAEFAVAYAGQNLADYETFKVAVDSGRLTAQTGL